MRVRFRATFFISLMGLALPGWAEEAPVSEKLKEMLLTDENIAERCRASINLKYDMVDTVDETGGARKAPRCVANYEAMRRVAESYLKQEEAAKSKIVTAIASCQENPDQESCLDAGKKLAAQAADLHDDLSQNADSAIELLAGNAGAK